MGHFDRGGRKNTGGGFRGGRDSGGFRGDRDNKRDGGGFRGNRDGGRPEMHRATCNKCGDECQVPFRPTGNKPVFCSNCFEKNDDRNSSYRGKQDRFIDKKLFKANCAECDAVCEVPFAPRPGRSIFCDACFSKQKNVGQSGNNAELAQKIDALHAKVDRVLKLLGENDKSPETKKKTTSAVKEIAKEEKPETKKVATKKKTSEDISFGPAATEKSSAKTKTSDEKKPKKAAAKKPVKKAVKKTTKKPAKKVAKKKATKK